ncbi:MAG: DUF2911 domain-containing protein [Gemmatimonadetes bacterium]|nr:DUF2911 domain-containing protein [Gemmatimonadota bacterium]
MKIARTIAPLALTLAFATAADAQDRPASPRGEAATQVGGSYNDNGRYEGGSWIVVDYGRPILRGRDLFGSGAEYGQAFLRGAPVWRLGANQSTVLMTETDLTFGGQRLPAGEYTVFAELTESEWTLIFSNWGAKANPRDEDPNTLWGSYNYTPDRDVLRTSMSVATSAMSADQMVIAFTDMTSSGGMFTVWWGDQVASAAFSVAR